MEKRLSCECDKMLRTRTVSIIVPPIFRGGKFSKLSKAETEIDLNPDQNDHEISELKPLIKKKTSESISKYEMLI